MDGRVEANSTSRGVEDCLQVKCIKTENSIVSTGMTKLTHTNNSDQGRGLTACILRRYGTLSTYPTVAWLWHLGIKIRVAHT